MSILLYLFLGGNVRLIRCSIKLFQNEWLEMKQSFDPTKFYEINVNLE